MARGSLGPRASARMQMDHFFLFAVLVGMREE